MLDFQQKRKIRSVAYHRATLIALSILVLFFIHSTWSVYTKKRESQKMKQISLEQVQRLTARDIELQDKIDRLKTSTGQEEEIRSKFNVVKGDENVVIVVDDNENLPTTTAKLGFWQKIWYFFYK